MKHPITMITITGLSTLLLTSAAMAQSVGVGTSASGNAGSGKSDAGAATTGTVGATVNSGVGARGITGTTTGKIHNNNTANNTAHNKADWNSEHSYWRDNYTSRPYYNKGRDFSTMEPAYRYGVELYNQHPGKRYDELNPSDITTGWTRARGKSQLGWNDAEQATRDAYDRMYNSNSDVSAGSETGSTVNNTDEASETRRP